MNQHEIGKKVRELREEQGLSQEELASRCGIKLRIVQKTEDATISPRVAELKKIGDELNYKFQFDENDDAKFWLLTLHLSNFILIPIIPFLIWKKKKDEIPEVDKHGKDVTNFQVSMLIYILISAMLAFVVVGFFMILIIAIYITVITIINSMHVVMERDYKYPLTIKFMK